MEQEFIIENTTDSERSVLEEHGVDWLFDSHETGDIVVYGREDYDYAVNLLNRTKNNKNTFSDTKIIVNK